MTRRDRRMRAAILAIGIVGASAAIASVVVQMRPRPASSSPPVETKPDRTYRGPAWLAGIVLGLIGVAQVIETIARFL